MCVVSVLMVGDVHGFLTVWDSVLRAQEEFQCDAIFCLGDFGWGWDGGAQTFTNPTGVPVYWIDGNHENFDDLYERFDYSLLAPQETQENVFWCPRGTILDLDGWTALCFGGGTSVDRQWRIPGESWWQQEKITSGEIDRAVANWGAHADVPHERRILLTHECPAEILPHALDVVHSAKVSDLASEHDRILLGELLERFDPVLHLHGHWHAFHSTNVGGLMSIGLADRAPQNVWVLR